MKFPPFFGQVVKPRFLVGWQSGKRGELQRIVDAMVNDGVYEGSLTQKIAHVFYKLPSEDGRAWWLHFKNINAWISTAVRVVGVYGMLNELTPYCYQVFFYRNHYLYDINVSNGILSVGLSLIPPEARLTASTPLPTAGETVFFDASGTTDNVDPLSSLQFRFDFDGDGVWDTSWTQGDPDESHVYTTVGPTTCIVEVQDTDGLTAQACRWFVSVR